MFWLKIISNFLKILRAGQTPNQIAGGFALGSVVGLSPTLTLQGLVVWFVIFVLNVNLSAALLSFILFTLFAYVFDPLFHRLGYILLVQIDALKGLWTMLYNAPIAPLSRFYNTVVMGSLVSGILLCLPVFLGMKRFVKAYRVHVGAKVERWRVYRVLSKSTIVQWYLKIRDLGGLS